MSFLSTCYGADIDALADEGDGFNNVTSSTITNFVLRQWTDVATTLGFLRPLSVVANGLRSRRDGLTGLHSAALATFEQWHRARVRDASPLSVSARLARARVRHEVLVGHAARRPGNVWVLDEPASSLADGAVYERGPGVMTRAFQDDTGPGYFHGVRQGERQGDHGWQGPVFLSLGTFPWVYGNRLHRTPPGLDWEEAGEWAPAVTAMRLCASLWQPEGNLAQDARVVVLAYRAYRQSVDEALRAVPALGARMEVGQLHRRGLWLDAQQSSLEVHTVAGPRGPLTASVHNYIVRRFAAFFALRRSLLSATAQLTPDLLRILAQNQDPCVRPLVAGAGARA